MRSLLRKTSSHRPAARPRSIGDELAWAARKLVRAGQPDPQKSSTGMWATLERLSPGAVWLRRDTSPSENLARQFRRAIAALAAGTPLQYAVGRAAFRTIELAVDAAVLIPRVETEGLVDQVLVWARDRHGDQSWGTAADIGTGSGAIGLALAVEGRFERVIATDLSAQALAVADGNRTALSPLIPVELRRGSMVTPLREGECDVIVSNPPYLTTEEWKRAAPEVRDYEPVLALDGGPDGLAPYRVLLSETARCLKPGGLLALELDSRRAELVQALAVAAGWTDARVVPDVFGRARYLLATNLERNQ
jgi:release factor glutamine methyltransferase